MSERQIRSYGVTMRDSKGASLRIRAKRSKKDGTVRVSVAHIVRGQDGRKIVKTGMTSSAADLEAGKAKVEEHATLFAKDGWVRGSARGFTAKADVFTADNRPKPNTVESFAKQKKAPASPAAKK